MRCAGSRAGHRPARRRARMAGSVAGLAFAVLLTACSGHSPGQPGGNKGGSAGRGPGGHEIIGIRVGGGGFAFVSSGPSSSGRPAITVGQIPPASSNVPISMPLDSYEEVAGLEQNAVSAAAALLMQRCMTAEGFQFTATAGSSGQQTVLDAIEDGYGLASLPQAQQFGYGQPKGSQPFGGPGAVILGGLVGSPKDQAHSKAWYGALLGFYPGVRIGPVRHLGCFQEAYQELYGQSGGIGFAVAIGADPVPGIAGQAASWTQTDSRITAANAAWSRCMRARGYSYRNPSRAAGAHWPSAPSSKETETAVADVSCKDQVNYVNTWLTVEAAYQQALIGENLPSLAKLQTSFGTDLSRAQLILDSPLVIGAGGYVLPANGKLPGFFVGPVHAHGG
jgi:hypothetical protein